MTKMFNLISTAAAVAFSIGCVTPSSTVFRPGEEKRMSIVQAVESLLTDPTFTALYADAVKNAQGVGKRLPVVTILRIENNADGSGDMATRQMYRRLQVAMRKTGKFTVIDPERGTLVTTVIPGGVAEGEKPDALQYVGEYSSPDFIMSGELVREETGVLSLNLTMQDVRTKTDFWSEVVTPSDLINR